MLALSTSQALAEQVLELLAGSDDVRALDNDSMLPPPTPVFCFILPPAITLMLPLS